MRVIELVVMQSILSGIIRVMSNELALRARPYSIVTRMTSVQIAFHSLPLPLYNTNRVLK